MTALIFWNTSSVTAKNLDHLLYNASVTSVFYCYWSLTSIYFSGVIDDYNMVRVLFSLEYIHGFLHSGQGDWPSNFEENYLQFDSSFDICKILKFPSVSPPGLPNKDSPDQPIHCRPDFLISGQTFDIL